MTTEELTKRLFEIDEVVSGHSEKLKTIFSQIGDLRTMTESIYKLTTSVETLTHEQHATQTKLDELAEDVDELRERPGKRWDDVVKVATTAIVTAVITYLLTHIGLV